MDDVVSGKNSLRNGKTDLNRRDCDITKSTMDDVVSGKEWKNRPE